MSAFAVPLITIGITRDSTFSSASMTFIVLFVPIFLSVIVFSPTVKVASVPFEIALVILPARSCKVLVLLKPIITSLPLVYWIRAFSPLLNS